MHSVTSAKPSEDNVPETLPLELTVSDPEVISELCARHEGKRAGQVRPRCLAAGSAAAMVPKGRILAFTTIAGILVSLCPTPASVAAAQQGENADRRQFEGFSFDLPSGWLPLVPGLAKTKADILLGGLRLGAKAEIMVDVGRPTLPSPEAVAEGFAEMWGGTVVPGIVDVDGEKAFQVQGTTPGRFLVAPSRNRGVPWR